MAVDAIDPSSHDQSPDLQRKRRFDALDPPAVRALPRLHRRHLAQTLPGGLRLHDQRQRETPAKARPQRALETGQQKLAQHDLIRAVAHRRVAPQLLQGSVAQGPEIERVHLVFCRIDRPHFQHLREIETERTREPRAQTGHRHPRRRRFAPRHQRPRAGPRAVRLQGLHGPEHVADPRREGQVGAGQQQARRPQRIARRGVFREQQLQPATFTPRRRECLQEIGVARVPRRIRLQTERHPQRLRQERVADDRIRHEPFVQPGDDQMRCILPWEFQPTLQFERAGLLFLGLATVAEQPQRNVPPIVGLPTWKTLPGRFALPHHLAPDFGGGERPGVFGLTAIVVPVAEQRRQGRDRSARKIFADQHRAQLLHEFEPARRVRRRRTHEPPRVRQIRRQMFGPEIVEFREKKRAGESRSKTGLQAAEKIRAASQRRHRFIRRLPGQRRERDEERVQPVGAPERAFGIVMGPTRPREIVFQPWHHLGVRHAEGHESIGVRVARDQPYDLPGLGRGIRLEPDPALKLWHVDLASSPRLRPGAAHSVERLRLRFRREHEDL